MSRIVTRLDARGVERAGLSPRSHGERYDRRSVFFSDVVALDRTTMEREVAVLQGVTAWNIQRADGRVRLALWWDFGHVIETDLPADRVHPTIKAGDHLGVPIGDTLDLYAFPPDRWLLPDGGASERPTDEEYRHYGWRVRRGYSGTHYTDPPDVERRAWEIRREGDLVHFVVRQDPRRFRSRDLAVTLPRTRFDRRIREGDPIATRITVTERGTLRQSVCRRRISLRERVRQFLRMARR